MFGRKHRGDSAKRSTLDAPVTGSRNKSESDSQTTSTDADILTSFNENENAKKPKEPKNSKGATDKNVNKKKDAKPTAKSPAKSQSRVGAAAPPPRPPMNNFDNQSNFTNAAPANSQPWVGAAAPPPPPPESTTSIDNRSEEALTSVDESHASGIHITPVHAQGHDPEMIHKILTKIHFPAMHPMFLAENVAPAVLPTKLLTDHEMVTIFIDCLSRSPNKFGLFPSDKRWNSNLSRLVCLASIVC